MVGSNVSAMPSKPYPFSSLRQPFAFSWARYGHNELNNLSSLCLNNGGSYSSSPSSLKTVQFHFGSTSRWRRTYVPSFSLQSKPRLFPSTSSTCRLHGWGPSQVKGGDTEGILSSEDIILDEQALELNLQKAIEEENYAQAAKIRDKLLSLQEDSKVAVLATNTRFYNAFRDGDLVAMHHIWAKKENVYCVHPGAGGISGYDLVMGSWELVCGSDYEFPLQIELKNVEVHVRGVMGYVTCMEVVKTKGSSSWGKQVATNVFERIDGQWFMCIHHASHVDL